MDIKIDIPNKLTPELITKLTLKQNDWTQELIDIGIVALRSIDKNYTDQGRPIRFRQSTAASLRHGMTLIDTGRLRRSTEITGRQPPNSPDKLYNLTKTRLTLGTKVPYYKYLEDMDATWHPIMIQNEDIDIFQRIIIRSIDSL